jgi:hypothetical protein
VYQQNGTGFQRKTSWLIFKQEKLFGRAREGNLGSRWIFLAWRATKKPLAACMWPADRYLPTPDLSQDIKPVSDLLL